MKPRYDKRTEALGELAYLTLNWLKHTRPTVKPKLFGYVYYYYKHPHPHKSLWVTADHWRLK